MHILLSSELLLPSPITTLPIPRKDQHQGFLSWITTWTAWPGAKLEQCQGSRCVPVQALPQRPHVPVPECVGAQVGILAILELSFDELVQGFLEQGLVLGVHVLDALQPGRSSLGSGPARKEEQQRHSRYYP